MGDFCPQAVSGSISGVTNLREASASTAQKPGLLPKRQGTAPPISSYLAPNVSTVKVEKPYRTQSYPGKIAKQEFFIYVF